MHRVRRRARPAVVGPNWIRHVRLVVRGVKIHAVPAAREEDLGAESIRTVSRWEIIGFLRGRAFVVKTCVGDGLGFEIITARALERIAGYHSKPFRESFKLVVVRTWALTMAQD